MQNLELIRSGLLGKKVFITGGTGFFGKSLLDFFKGNDINVEVTVLSRNPDKFISTYSELAQDVNFIKGDIIDIPKVRDKYDFIIHAAAMVTGGDCNNKEFSIVDEIITGTRNILEFANDSQASRILNISSGAVYGRQPEDVEYFVEEYLGAPDTSNPVSAYGEGKRVSELLCAINKENTGLEYVNARCFSFVGKYLPLDSHFAIGNFIGNGLKNENLMIKGNGTPLRSYMYTDDLVVWLMTLLLLGSNGQSYNVGSDKSYSIKEVAHYVSQFFPNSNVIIEHEAEVGLSATRYIPSVEKCKNQLGLNIEFNLIDSIRKTVEYLKE